jgi:hypothetical protein
MTHRLALLGKAVHVFFFFTSSDAQLAQLVVFDWGMLMMWDFVTCSMKVD